MRRLGATLGVQAMSLYHHVGSREELADAIAERIYRPADQVELGSDWREAAARFARALRSVAVQSPRVFRLVGLHPGETPRVEAERLVSVLVAAGFSRPQALVMHRAVASYARGYALGEVGGFIAGVGEIEADESFERGLQALLDGFRPR